MDLVDSLKNLEKILNQGEYSTAFDKLANKRSELTQKEAKASMSKTMGFILFKVAPIAFIIAFALGLFL